MSPFGFNFMFTLVPIMIMITFVIVIGGLIINGVKGVKQWNSNNNSPVLTVQAEVVAKRMSVRGNHHHHHGDHHHHSSTYTTYFITFEFESGDRLELVVPDTEYGLLVEGDEGKVTFQGTRYQGFIRSKE